MAKMIAKMNKDINDDMLLGYMFFQKYPSNLKIDETMLEKLMNDSNIDLNYLRKISQRDAFRRATTKAKQKILVNTSFGLNEANIEIDEVKHDSNGITRLLGRKLINEDDEEVAYTTVGKLLYDAQNQTMSTQIDTKYANEYDYSVVINEIMERYLEWSNFHTRDTVKNMTVRIINDMYPINLLDSGLAKFIPIVNKNSLFNLQQFVRSLNDFGNKDGAFEIIPVIDTEEQRNVIYRQAVSSISSDMNELVETLNKVIKDKGEISPRVAETYINKFKEMKKMVAEYEKTVGAYMDVLNKQLVKALDYVDSKVYF